jgi:hypothetical protein
MYGRGFLTVIGSALIGLAITNCSNKGQAPDSGVTLNMPQVTEAVSGASLMSNVGPFATTGQKLNNGSCSACGSGALMNVWSLGSTFVLQGKMADVNSCIISAMAAAGVVPGLTSGDAKYFTSSGSKTKVKITADGSTIKTFEIFSCEGATQNQFMGGTNTNGNVTFEAKMSGSAPSVYFVSMSATGTMSGSNWTSKSLDVSYSLSNTYSLFTIAQQSDYLDISGISDSGTLGTLDANDVRLVSRAQLIGSDVQTYAMGDGAVRMALGANAASATNWNGDTGVVGSGPTTYDSVVASATLPSIPTTRITAFESDEQWDCNSDGSDVDLESVAATNPSLMSAVQECIGDFE